MVTLEKSFATLFKDNQKERQYSNSIGFILRTIKFNGIEDVISHLPSSITEIEFATKIWDRIICIDKENKQKEFSELFFEIIKPEIWINIVIDNFDDRSARFFMEKIPTKLIKQEPISKTINSFLSENLNRDDLMRIYCQKCNVDPQILINFIEKLDKLSRGITSVVAYLGGTPSEEISTISTVF